MPRDNLSGKPVIGINVFENTLNQFFDNINSFKSLLRHEVLHFYNFEKILMIIQALNMLRFMLIK